MRRLLAGALFVVASAAVATPIPVGPRVLQPDNKSSMTRPEVTVASNGRTFIVAWEDQFMPGYPQGKVYYRTYGERGAAEQQQPGPAIIGAYGPAVAWNGSEWVIVASYTFAPGGPGDQPIIEAARIAEHGAPIGGQVALLRSGTPPPLTAGIASNGSQLMIGNGQTVITAPDLTSPRPLRLLVRPMAAIGGTFLVRNHVGNLLVLTGGGDVLATIPLERGMTAAATANGGEYAIVITSSAKVESITVDADGTITHRQTLQTNASASQPAVTFGSGFYLAAWALPNELCTESFTSDSIGVAHCEPRPATPGSIALTAGTSATLLAWSERIAATRTDLVFTRFITSSGSEESVATSILTMQGAPRIEKTADGVAVRWIEPGSRSRLMSASFTPSAGMRPSTFISTDATDITRLHLRTAHAAAGTLAVWAEGTRIVAQLAHDDGSLEPSFPLGDGAEPEVASDGDGWLAVWQTSETTPRLVSTLITSDRTVVSPGGLALARSTSAQTHPAVASRGSDYLVAWSEATPMTQLMAIGVSTAGNPNGGVLDLASTLGEIQQIQIAASGRLYLIVVQDPENDIGVPVTSLVKDILVAGVASNEPWRVRGYDGGFALLQGYSIHTRFIDMLGHDRPGPTLPLEAADFDFFYDGPRLVLAYSQPDSYLSSRVLLDIIGPRARPVGMR